MLRDVATSPIGGTPVQRRYELEGVLRPLATDQLELAVGGQIGETRRDVDGWARATVRASRGVFVHAMVASRALHVLDDTATGVIESDSRDLRATLGVEVSFGHAGATALGTGLRDVDGNAHALGGTFVVRVSEVAIESVLGETDHIERIELEGAIGARELTTLVLHLRAIARDVHVKGLVVTFNDPAGGWSTFQELRGELVRIRAAHKKVYAYMLSGRARDYLVASAADRIYIDPAGGLRLTRHRRDVDVLPRRVLICSASSRSSRRSASTRARPKSSPRPARRRPPRRCTPTCSIRCGMAGSTRSRRAATWTKPQLQAIVDNGPYTAGELARDTKLVDGVGPPDKVSEWVLADLGAAYPVDAAPVDRPDRWQRPKIAVIYIDGDITDGKSQSIPLIG